MGRQIVVAGVVKGDKQGEQFGKKGTLYMFAITDGEGRRLMLNSQQLSESGYRVQPRSECVAELFYQSYHETVVCAGALPRPAQTLPVQPVVVAAAPAEPSTPTLTIRIPRTPLEDLMTLHGLINALGLLALAYALGFLTALQVLQPVSAFPF